MELFARSHSSLFQNLTAKFINSATTVSFDNTMKTLKPLRENYPALDVFVNSYSQVKHKIVRCLLKSSLPIQSSRLAETSNWSSQAGGNIWLSLFDFVLRDINESAVLESSYTLTKQGQPTSSQSPSYEDLSVRQVTRVQQPVSSVQKKSLICCTPRN